MEKIRLTCHSRIYLRQQTIFSDFYIDIFDAKCGYINTRCSIFGSRKVGFSAYCLLKQLLF